MKPVPAEHDLAGGVRVLPAHVIEATEQLGERPGWLDGNGSSNVNGRGTDGVVHDGDLEVVTALLATGQRLGRGA